jgi:hypothetical protein
VRALAVLLAVAAIGSMVVSLASHEQDAVSAWTMYTPLSNEADHDGIGPLGEIDQSLGVATPEIERAPTYDEYDGMPWDDARLWLGLAIGFAVSAVAVGLVSLRRRA